MCQKKGTTHEPARFDVVTRTLTSLPSRRDVLRGLAGPGSASAPFGSRMLERRRTRKRRARSGRTRSETRPQTDRSHAGGLAPLVFNRYGCVDVGQPVRRATPTAARASARAPRRPRAAGQQPLRRPQRRCLHGGDATRVRLGLMSAAIRVFPSASAPVRPGRRLLCGHPGWHHHALLGLHEDTDCQGESDRERPVSSSTGAAQPRDRHGRTACPPAGA